MPTVGEIERFLEELAPVSMKMDWDNVGLLCGSAGKEVHRILVALDPFLHVCREAAECGAELLVTHHPLIFVAPRSVTDADTVGQSILFLAAHGISAVNAHTNLDQAPGGVNDCLAHVLGLRGTQVIAPEGTDGQGRPWGLLRMGEIDETTPEAFAAFVRDRLGCPGVRFVDGGRPIRRVAVGGGACGDEVMSALDAGCDALVTADVKYNQFWNAKDFGLTLIDAGHFETENPVTAYLAAQLRARFPELTVLLSQTHRDPIRFL